jgi:general secretion pathway protein F
MQRRLVYNRQNARTGFRRAAPLGSQAIKPPISLDDFLALNDEISALVRAGVPLESGLVGLGHELSGGMGRIAADLGERLKRGESLPQAVASERARFGSLYLAVVEAGVKSGRLAAALEGLGVTARRMGELRQAAGTAMLYPFIVLLLAYAMFVGFVVKFAPAVLPAYESFGAPATVWLRWFAGLGATANTWGPLVPLVAVLATCAWWWQSGRVLLLQPRWTSRLLGWIPGLRKLLAYSQAATFAEVLALLIEQQLPLSDGVTLAAEATGSQALVKAAREMSAALVRGEPAERCLSAAPGFPPLLGWLMVSGHERGLLVKSLRHAAASYNQRALRRSDAARVVLPLLTVGMGGSVVVVYALVVLLPWISLLNKLVEA